jgi:hypothetical protein
MCDNSRFDFRATVREVKAGETSFYKRQRYTNCITTPAKVCLENLRYRDGRPVPGSFEFTKTVEFYDVKAGDEILFRATWNGDALLRPVRNESSCGE